MDKTTLSEPVTRSRVEAFLPSAAVSDSKVLLQKYFAPTERVYGDRLDLGSFSAATAEFIKDQAEKERRTRIEKAFDEEKAKRESMDPQHLHELATVLFPNI